MQLINAEHLKVQFNHQAILNDFSFDVRAGEFIGVLGPNGAGKSTLLKLILGLIKPTSGRLVVLGQPARCGHKNIGYLPQSRLLSSGFNMTGFQLLSSTFRAQRYGLPLLFKEDKEKIHAVLADVGAEEIAKRAYGSLSGGERQRLLLAQTLLNEPKILLLDEPLNNLDPHYQEVLVELVARVCKKKQIAVLFTAHDVNALLPVVDRVLYLVNGDARLGSVSEVITSQNLSALYGTHIEVMNYRGRLIVLGQEHGLCDWHHHCES